MTALDSSHLRVSAPPSEALYRQFRLALARFEDTLAEDPVRATAWAAAAKALEYLDDECSIADALSVAHRAIDRGDEQRALLVVSAVAGRLPPDGSALVRLGDRACSAGLLDVVCAVGRQLRRAGAPVPAGWTEALPEDKRGDLVGELLDKPQDGVSGLPVEPRTLDAQPLDSRQGHPVRDVLREAFRCIERANARGAGIITGTPTGFDAYDRLTGGLHDGELTVIAARPGMGKTSFVLDLAANVASAQEVVSAHDPTERWLEPGRGVLVFSPHGSRRQAVNRMLCSEARIDTGKVRSGILAKRDWEQLTRAAGRLAALPIWVNDTPDLSPLDFRSVIGRLQAEWDRFDSVGSRTQRLGLVVIDGCYRVRRARRALRRLRDIARELMVPIIATVALEPVRQDGARGRRPQLSDLPLSDDDADSVCFIHRDAYYDRDAELDVVEVIVASQRNGPTDTVKLRWEPQYGRVDNHPEDGRDG